MCNKQTKKMGFGQPWGSLHLRLGELTPCIYMNSAFPLPGERMHSWIWRGANDMILPSDLVERLGGDHRTQAQGLKCYLSNWILHGEGFRAKIASLGTWLGSCYKSAQRWARGFWRGHTVQKENRRQVGSHCAWWQQLWNGSLEQARGVRHSHNHSLPETSCSVCLS